MNLTEQEQYLIQMLRELRPYEVVTITADKEGKPNRYLVKRSQQIMVSEIGAGAVRCPIEQ